MLHAAAVVRDLRLVRSSLAKCQMADLVLRKTAAAAASMQGVAVGRLRHLACSVLRSSIDHRCKQVSNLINLRIGQAAPSSCPTPQRSATSLSCSFKLHVMRLSVRKISTMRCLFHEPYASARVCVCYNE